MQRKVAQSGQRHLHCYLYFLLLSAMFKIISPFVLPNGAAEQT